MDDNIDRLLKAIEHPEDFTDSELEQILEDPEVREAYRMITRAQDTLCEFEMPDADQEWRKFSALHSEKNSARRSLNFKSLFSGRKAAVITGVAVTIAAVAAGIGIRMASGENAATQADATLPTAENISEKAASPADCDTIIAMTATEPDTIIFKDEHLDRIVAEIAKYYGTQTKFASPGKKDLRLFFKWNQALPLAEVIGQLNAFEQIDIKLADNLITVK